MLIAVDIGNTTILVAGLEGQEIAFSFRMTTDKEKSAAEYTVQLRELTQIYGEGAGAVTGAVLSSVVPEITGALEKAIHRNFGVETIVVKRDVMPDFPIDLDYPASIGSDRVADAAAVIREYPLPAIVFDLGTATTCSVIDEKGTFCGGLISPGVRTASDALLKKASQLTSYELGEPKQLIGKNTEECMISGAVMGTAGLLDGLVAGIEEELGEQVTLVITGGGAGYVDHLIRHPHVLDENMILKGLAYLYVLNCGKEQSFL